jgi:hypothetical protein
MNILIDSEKNEAKTFALSVSAETMQAVQAANNTLTVSDVRSHFQGHYANAQERVYGILMLVADVLAKHDAEFPRNAHTGELRKIVAAGSMFTSEILAEVESRFAAGGMRYKVQAVKNVLSTYGVEFIAKIQLTKTEDMPRECDKPRCKWYLIQGQMENLRKQIESRKGNVSK